MKLKPSHCDAESLSRFLRGELSDVEIKELETHLSACSTCRTRLDESTASQNEWHALRDSLNNNQDSDSIPGSEDLASLKRLLGPSDNPQMMGRIGTYEIVGLLGRGGMGVVFKAFDPSLNRYVAIKMLAPMLIQSVVFKQRFLREAQSAAAVVHDNVVGIHAISEWQGSPYLVMTFVRGQSLQSRLQHRGHLSLREVLRIGLQISAGLEAAHAQGLIHRDIKPANILLESDVDRVMITDFGIAKAIDDLRFTRTNTLLGTPEYMSPEQARDEELDYRTDLFSLGCVIYEASTGRSPFRSSTPYGAIRKVIDENPPSVRSLVSELPEWFAEIVRQLLNKDKNSRFQSAAEVAALLKQCLAHVEQPQLVPFPKSFFQSDRPSRSKTFIRRLVMATPWIAFVSIGSWLLLLQVGQPSPDERAGKQLRQSKPNRVQEESNESQQSSAETPNDEQEAPITAKVGKYFIKVTKTDAIDQMKLGRKPSTNRATDMLLEHLQNGSTQNQNNNQFFGGNGNGSGSSGGVSGGFSSGSSSTSGSVTNGRNGGFVRPNIAVALEIEPSDKGIFELENIKAVDDKGEPVLWMGPSPFNFYDPNFENGLKSDIFAYFQEENATEYLTISGDLKVTPGRRIEVEFPNGKPSTKKSGEYSFVLRDVQSNENGIHVTLSLPQLTKKRGNQFGNAQAMMKAVLEQQGAFEVMIQDTEGVLHSPGASGSAGGSSSGSSSGSGGGSGSSGGSFGEDSHSDSTQTFTFGGLPYGQEIKSIIVRATEKTGKPQSYRFELQNIPVPYGIK